MKHLFGVLPEEEKKEEPIVKGKAAPSKKDIKFEPRSVQLSTPH